MILTINAQFSFCFGRTTTRRMVYASRVHRGGIAQLVERQLCKLDVRGSNPLASTNVSKIRFPSGLTATGL